MRYWRSFFVYAFITSACLIALYGGAGTTRGLTLMLKGIQYFLPGQLKIVGLKGSLIGPLYVEQFTYEDNDYQLNISNLYVEWKKTALLRGRFFIRSFHIDRFIINVISSNPSKETKQLSSLSIPQIPLFLRRLHLDKGSIKHFIIQTNSIQWRMQGALGVNTDLTWQLRYRQRIPSLKDFNTLDVQGELTGRWEGKIPIFSLKGSSSQNFQWYMHESPQPSLITIPKFKVNSHYKNDKWQVHLTLPTTEKESNDMTMTIILPYYQANHLPTPRQHIHMELQLNLKEWTILEKIGLPLDIFYLTNISGPLSIHFNLKTTLRHLQRCIENPERYLFRHSWLSLLNAPFLESKLSLSWKEPIIPKLGVQFKQCDVQGLFQQNHINWEAQLSANKEDSDNDAKTTWQLTGKTYLQLNKLFSLGKSVNPLQTNTTLRLTGDAMPLFTQTNYSVSLQPWIDIHIDHQKINITGKLYMPKAKFNLQYNDEVIALDRDVQFIDQHQAAKPSILPFNMQLQLQLGKGVYFYYEGLKARMAGELQLIQQASRPVSANGEIQLVEGSYYYYGQALEIEPHSRLIFTEWFYNPKIDITASREIQMKPGNNTLPIATLRSVGAYSRSQAATTKIKANLPMQVKVGVHVRGDMEDPQMTLFSSPPGWITDSTDTLSYIITGQPISRLSSTAASLLINAAAQLGSGYVSYHGTMADFQKKLGVKFDIQTEELLTQTQLIVSKQLSPKWTIAYKMGMKNSDHILKASYLLNQHFLVEVERNQSNPAMGIDLLHQRELG